MAFECGAADDAGEAGGVQPDLRGDQCCQEQQCLRCSQISCFTEAAKPGHVVSRLIGQRNGVSRKCQGNDTDGILCAIRACNLCLRFISPPYNIVLLQNNLYATCNCTNAQQPS